MSRFLFLFILFLSSFSGYAQKKFTISGIIKDAASGETLIGASIRIQELSTSGTSTNNYGFYAVTSTEGEYNIQFSYIGYETVAQKVSLRSNQTLNISLKPSGTLQEVVVRSSRSGTNRIRSPQMGLEKLNMAQINMVPVIMGERDILKTITLMPGIKSGGEGNAGFFVRGGAADQNLILLDEAPVYNASHLLGFFSTFNSDAIKDVSIYKGGGMPAEYGGRLSSVLDVKMNDGNNQNFTVQGGLGLIASRLKVEGPLVKDKGSFMVSARRTYVDLFLKASSDSTVNSSKLYFYDLNAKANYHFNDKNTLYLSGYFGKDVLGVQDIFGTNWGNSTATLRFNHLFSNKLFSNTSLIFSNYSYVVQQFQNQDEFKIKSQIRDWNLKEDFQYEPGSNHSLKFGLNVLYHQISPGEIKASANSSFNDIEVEDRYGYEAAAYLSDEWKVSDKLTLLFGLRMNGMFVMGPGTFKTYHPDGTASTVNSLGSGKLLKSYFNPEPRFSASYLLDEYQSVKFSYGRNTQNIHLLSNSTSSTPTDVYVMSSNNIKPEIADQLSAGYYRNFSNDEYELSTEAYYKWMQNQIDYKDGAQLLVNSDVESLLTYGSGRAYGVELLLKKKHGRLNGWIGYTLSRTERKFDAINTGSYYPARQDRTHDLSLVGIYKLNKRWSFSSAFIYGTGNAVTYPTGKYTLNGLTMYSYSERNGYRLPATHRLDIGATLEGKDHKRFHSSWTFSVYNVYGYQNPYAITFRDSKTIPNTTEAVRTSLFPIPIPSVTWNFKF
jgi:hypothetical protein